MTLALRCQWFWAFVILQRWIPIWASSNTPMDGTPDAECLGTVDRKGGKGFRLPGDPLKPRLQLFTTHQCQGDSKAQCRTWRIPMPMLQVYQPECSNRCKRQGRTTYAGSGTGLSGTNTELSLDIRYFVLFTHGKRPDNDQESHPRQTSPSWPRVSQVSQGW